MSIYCNICTRTLDRGRAHNPRAEMLPDIEILPPTNGQQLSESSLQRRIDALKESGSSTKARVFPDALENELADLEARRNRSLQRRRNLKLAINTEASKLLEPSADVIRLRKSNADSVDRLVTLVEKLAQDQAKDESPHRVSPIKHQGLSPTVPLSLSRLPSYRSTARQEKKGKNTSAPREKSNCKINGLLSNSGFYSTPTSPVTKEKASSPSSSPGEYQGSGLSGTRRLSHSNSFCGAIRRHHAASNVTGKSGTLSASDLRAERT